MTDLVIISMHDKGFPQADFYCGAGDMDAREFNCLGRSPDGFFTLKRGETLAAAFAKAREEWPGAKLVEAENEDEDSDE